MPTSEIHDSLLHAWRQIRDRLASDPAELQARLDRRNSAQLKRPPRAWCLAVRANDTRLEKYFASRASKEHPNEVVLDRDALYSLCAPVHLQGGHTLEETAAELGIPNPDCLVTARLRGVFTVRHVPGLGGKPGRPRPLLSATRPLDPSSHLFQLPDPAWHLTLDDLVYNIPEDIKAILTRVPVHRDMGRALRKENLHPEHELYTGRSRPYKSRKLPPPEPDYVWYKWKDGQYVGHDWRNPAAVAGFKRHQQALEKGRAAARLRRSRKWQKERVAYDPLEFYGHRWQCPTCPRKTHILFLPLAQPNFLAGDLGPFEDDERFQDITFLPFKRHFACRNCHHIFQPSRMQYECWNQIVSYLTGGLLYGKEVPRPDWFTKDRKYAFAPKLLTTPSRRRPQIQQLLVKGLTYQQIGKELGIHWRTVRTHARKIFLQQGLTSREQFLTKHGLPCPPRHRPKLPKEKMKT